MGMCRLAEPDDVDTCCPNQQADGPHQHADQEQTKALLLGSVADALDRLSDEDNKNECGCDRNGRIRKQVTGKETNLLTGEVPGRLVGGRKYF